MQRVRQVFDGARPDRVPVFDLIPNDTVLRYFNGGAPVESGDDRSGVRALVEATDATRFSFFSPMQDHEEQLPNGRLRKYQRWTYWTSHIEFSSSEEYCRIKNDEVASLAEQLDKPVRVEDDPFYQQHQTLSSWFGSDYYLLLYIPSPGLMILIEEVGLEAFSYYLYDCEQIIIEQLEHATEHACRWLDALPPDDPFQAVFIGEDIAYKSGPMVNPAWLDRHYFPRLKRVIDRAHARGKKVIFHSDGDLNPIMDGLVEAGIDGLNPIEVAAGMDMRELHNRYPKLVFVGGIDVSHLLPFGNPAQVRDAVVKAVDDTEGQILIGSSTEVMDNVPLENFLAMRDAAMDYRF